MSRSVTRWLIATTALLGLSLSTATAGPLVFFDEWGNGAEHLGGAVFGLPSGVSPDPLSGIATLSYALGKGVSGDVIIYEDPQFNVVSDVVRFIGGSIYVFSDPSEPGEIRPPADVSPADWAFIIDPAHWQVNHVRYLEMPVVGGNGLHWVPAAGDPGYYTDATGAGVEYTFVSDSPEPSTIAGALVGLIGVGLYRQRRRHLGRV